MSDTNSVTVAMSMTGLYQFPQNKCICAKCGMHCWVEQKDAKVVASHPTHPTCPNSHQAFEVPVTNCARLSQEFFSKEIA